MKTFAAIIALAGIAQLASATAYAEFCNDANCSEGCGISVSTDNPGCLQESGRQSVKIHGTNIQSVNLVSSPDSSCSCQNNCNFDVVHGGPDSNERCFPLTGPTANSYRWVGDQSCDENNC